MYTGTGTANKSYYHANHQGSIVAMSNGSGNVTEQHTYSSYGESDDLTGNPFRYTGRRLDSETGLYYYRARYYSSAIGRFLQTDPIGYGDGLNWYAYVGNDPLGKNDPSGLATCGPTLSKLECKTALRAQKNASKKLKKALKNLTTLKEKIKNDSASDKDVGGFEKFFGEGSATEEGVGDVITAVNGAIGVLDSNNSGFTLESGDPAVTGPNTAAYVRSDDRSKIFFQKHFFKNLSSSQQGNVLRHEPFHNLGTGITDQKYSVSVGQYKKQWAYYSLLHVKALAKQGGGRSFHNAATYEHFTK